MKKELKDTKKDNEILSLRKQIGDKDRQIQAGIHRINTGIEVVKELKGLIEAKDALIKASVGWMAYLINQISKDGEVTIQKDEAYTFLDKYDIAPKFNDDGTITIRIVKKGEPDGTTNYQSE